MRALALVLALAAPASATEAQDQAARLNDYPTEARADYVFACMAANGQTRDMLRRCSCSIDHIAEVLPYDAYVEAETVLAMLQTSGERVELFRGSATTNKWVGDLRRAQAEAEIMCFE